MRALTSREILEVWEKGESQALQDRAISLLAMVCPGLSRDRLGMLTVSERDRFLLELRERTFGSTLKGFALCPGCGERLEFTLAVSDIRQPPAEDSAGKEHLLELPEADIRLRFRVPNGLDLATVSSCESVQEAKGLLLERCVLEATQYGKSIKLRGLPSEIIDHLSARLSELEPQAEVLLDLQCSVCPNRWQMMLDILSYFWTEISVEAKRLLREVHRLASAYGWREEDILSMSQTRRRFYLEILA